MTSHAVGDLYLLSAFLPGFFRTGELPASIPAQRWIGCLDAPTLLPAGACERHELMDGRYAFPASQLCVRGFDGETRSRADTNAIRRIERNTYDEEGRN